MRYWVQFLDWSTGYVEGSIPPRFEESAKTLIDVCGDRGVYILDGRNSQETMLIDALRYAQRCEHFRKYVAFQLCKGESLARETQRGPVVMLTYPIRTS